MIAVIFEVWPASGRRDDYLAIAAKLRTELEKMDGFVSVERFQSLTDPAKLLSLSFWRDEDAVRNWRNHEEHRRSQAAGRGGIFADYRLRIATLARDYGMAERNEAPGDSRAFHQSVAEPFWNAPMPARPYVAAGHVLNNVQIEPATGHAMTVQPSLVQALGYVGVRAKNLEDWAGYGQNFLGLQKIDKSRQSMAFRMDDRKQRLVVDADGGQGIGFFGWEMADATALDTMATRLEKMGTKVARGSRALADERHVKDLIVVNDPEGNRLEFFHGGAIASDPFKPGRNISGFRTGSLGMGHVVMHCERLNEVMPFYQEVLEFKLSDYWLRPFAGYFFHVNGRHHSIALVETGKKMVHHMMLELFSLDDVGQGYDLVQNDPDKIAVTMGRHSGDYVTSFYTWNPSGFMVEYGWGGQVIDDSTWTPFERKHGPSLWGHDRRWMSADKREESRLLCIESAEAGLRQPVQVIDGNYNRMPGVCPWWDQMKAQKTG